MKSKERENDDLSLGVSSGHGEKQNRLGILKVEGIKCGNSKCFGQGWEEKWGKEKILNSQERLIPYQPSLWILSVYVRQEWNNWIVEWRMHAFIFTTYFNSQTIFFFFLNFGWC